MHVGTKQVEPGTHHTSQYTNHNALRWDYESVYSTPIRAQFVRE